MSFRSLDGSPPLEGVPRNEAGEDFSPSGKTDPLEILLLFNP
jgi:hypothetical protein